jgi:hypothetical protein
LAFSPLADGVDITELLRNIKHRSIQAQITYPAELNHVNISAECPVSVDTDVCMLGGYGHSLPIIGLREGFNGEMYTVFACPGCGSWFALAEDDMDKLAPNDHTKEIIRPLVVPENVVA